MAELVDALVSNTSDSNIISVRPRFRVLSSSEMKGFFIWRQQYHIGSPDSYRDRFRVLISSSRRAFLFRSSNITLVLPIAIGTQNQKSCNQKVLRLFLEPYLPFFYLNPVKFTIFALPKKWKHKYVYFPVSLQKVLQQK